MTLEQLKQAADELSADERRTLAEYLIASSDADDATEPDAEVLEAWLDEAERRLENWESGKTKGVPYEDVIQKLRRNSA